MPMIHTNRNYIMVGKAFPEDRFVATYIMRDGGRFLLTTQPIDRLASAVRWALNMADYMAGPIEVLPIKSEDELLRQIVVAVGFEGIHAQTDPAMQREAHDLLTKLGILP
ncbi:hypothetical protein SAMN06265365_1704 [Tistlia consotensis]|uniref:Uncharacterized protein n=1 Tax=Tistlia consotensis USBA 355 TaxID=560819 RepID=A0A1Y6CSA8_9PROT|nr:hypothetical protein [Tistlia consotensis]SMF85662.1 hypothetical protein SAMN05428998_1684 [Tistlia consotensis USBA 355]SNS40813.1 hypothetical protein SAMN06265365_1704 [Tistlia consotensis]